MAEWKRISPTVYVCVEGDRSIGSVRKSVNCATWHATYWDTNDYLGEYPTIEAAKVAVEEKRDAR